MNMLQKLAEETDIRTIHLSDSNFKSFIRRYAKRLKVLEQDCKVNWEKDNTFTIQFNPTIRVKGNLVGKVGRPRISGDIMQKIIEYIDEEKMTFRQVGRTLGVSHTTARRWYYKLKKPT